MCNTLMSGQILCEQVSDAAWNAGTLMLRLPWFNWASVACLFKDWESLRDKSAKRWLKRTVAGRTPDTGEPHTSDCVGDKAEGLSK